MQEEVYRCCVGRGGVGGLFLGDWPICANHLPFVKLLGSGHWWLMTFVWYGNKTQAIDDDRSFIGDKFTLTIARNIADEKLSCRYTTLEICYTNGRLRKIEDLRIYSPRVSPLKLNCDANPQKSRTRWISEYSLTHQYMYCSRPANTPLACRASVTRRAGLAAVFWCEHSPTDLGCHIGVAALSDNANWKEHDTVYKVRQFTVPLTWLTLLIIGTKNNKGVL